MIDAYDKKPGNGHLRIRLTGNYRVYILVILMTLFLGLRDIYSIGINKFIFLGLTMLCVLIMKSHEIVYLLCFLFPLYVGLPGNYMTLLFLLRFVLFDHKELRLRSGTMLLVMAVTVFMFLQNLVTGYTEIIHMMYIPGLFMVWFLLSNRIPLCRVKLVVFYALGTAATGFIMLAATLRIYELHSLLDAAFRLGSAAADYMTGSGLNVGMDPNFYGMFTIAAISLGVPQILDPSNGTADRVILAASLAVSLSVSLIGMSRAFFMMLIVWVMLYLLSQRRIREMVIAAGLFAGVILLFVIVFPEVLDSLLARFLTVDMITGNGRIPLICRFFARWSENLITMLTGVGLFACNVHCMPLQYLFGGGILLTGLILGFVLSLRTLGQVRTDSYLEKWLPMLVTFGMSCSIPAGGMLNFLFPLVVVGMSMKCTVSAGNRTLSGAEQNNVRI